MLPWDGFWRRRVTFAASSSADAFLGAVALVRGFASVSGCLRVADVPRVATGTARVMESFL